MNEWTEVHSGYTGRAELQRMTADTAVMWQRAGLLENSSGSQTSVGSWSQKTRWFFEANMLSYKQHRPMQVATAAQQRTGAQPAHYTFLPPKFCLANSAAGKRVEAASHRGILRSADGVQVQLGFGASFRRDTGPGASSLELGGTMASHQALAVPFRRGWRRSF